MISKKTLYAFKALIHLSGTPSGQSVLIADLARDENIPKKFLEYILLTLRKGGLLQSRVGKGGGYMLALPANRISVGSIVRILEGDIALVQCLSETNYARCEECKNEVTCGIRLVIADVNSVLKTAFDGLTLADMLERSEYARQKASRNIDYSI
jgi:Rrf2 family protein